MINKAQVFHTQFPDAYYFDEHHLERLPEYLLKKGIITSNEILLTTEKPGEGNMNFVQRATTDKRSFIIKQCRPWVEKYPHISAPVERLTVEARYYQFIADDPFFSQYSPKMIAYDPENLLIVFEDLGIASDFTFCYQKSENFNDYQVASLLRYISHLHNMEWRDRKETFPTNQALKQLNHEHIFNYPYMIENGFDLDAVHPGLQAISMQLLVQ